VIATNDNDILARTLETGVYETRGVIETTSPSMDIQVSSNFERLLFEASGRDASVVRGMQGLRQSGRFTIGDDAEDDPQEIRRRDARRWRRRRPLSEACSPNPAIWQTRTPPRR
jgi:threonine synthase